MKMKREYFVPICLVIALAVGSYALYRQNQRAMRQLNLSAFSLGCQSVGNAPEYCRAEAAKFVDAKQ